MEATPPPVLTQIRVTNHVLPVWRGRVRIERVSGWQDNPRILMHVEKFNRDHGRGPSQDDIFEIMKNDPEVRLKDLKKDIENNGVRHEIWLSKDGVLLDGNRRYFAARFAMEGMSEDDARRPLVSSLPVIVLVDALSDHDNQERERLVMVQQNFSADLKEPWSDFVKAKMVFRDFDEKGYEPKLLAERYNWKKPQVESALKTYKYIQEFITYVTTPVDNEEPDRGGLGLDDDAAEDLASKHYQKFNEAQKSFREALDQKTDFKRVFFRLIAEDKFKTWADVRHAYSAWEDPNIRKVLMSGRADAPRDARIQVELKARNEASALSHEQEIDGFIKFLSTLEVGEILQIPKEKINELKVKVEAVFASKNSKSG